MTTVFVVVVLVVCGAAGLWAYLHGGPNGGRATYRTTQEEDRERLARTMRRNRTFERAEEEHQRRLREQLPPTHEEP